MVEKYPGSFSGVFELDYFLRIVNSVIVPAVIAARIPSGVFAFTAMLINALTFSISDSLSSVAISDSLRFTNAANFRGVDFAIWIESIFFAWSRNCAESIWRNFATEGAEGAEGAGGVEVVLRAIFL